MNNLEHIIFNFNFLYTIEYKNNSAFFVEIECLF